MTIKEFNGLNILIDHATRDMSYGEGGSYNLNDEFDSKAAAQAREGIKYIMRLLMKKQHQFNARNIAKKFHGIEITV